ncbi:MAG: hypothetical protein KatS3mg012_0640 [Gaiellaceae bacterium]|nr:MAG: hypothetical protein KatS3mg012_0640 [Gaiellaceae bacterium]
MFLQSIRRGFVPQASTPEPREVRIRVRAGYEPGTVVSRAGQPLRLIFRREDQLVCTEEVVFPFFGRSATLPAGEDVPIDLLPTEPGVYAFTCGWGMLSGLLVVTGEDGRRFR